MSRQGTKKGGYFLGMDANCLMGNPGGRKETQAMRMTLGPEAGKVTEQRGKRMMAWLRDEGLIVASTWEKRSKRATWKEQ